MLLVFLIGALVAQLSATPPSVSPPIGNITDETVRFDQLPSVLARDLYILHNAELLKDCLLGERHPIVLPELPLEFVNPVPPSSPVMKIHHKVLPVEKRHVFVKPPLVRQGAMLHHDHLLDSNLL